MGRQGAAVGPVAALATHGNLSQGHSAPTQDFANFKQRTAEVRHISIATL